MKNCKPPRRKFNIYINFCQITKSLGLPEVILRLLDYDSSHFEKSTVKLEELLSGNV